MNLSGTVISCGVHQLSGLTNPEADLKDIGQKLFAQAHSKQAFLIWSDTVGRGRGEGLFKLIEKTFPKSSVQKTANVKNPNSANEICLYNWQVPEADLRAWWNDSKKAEAKKKVT